MSPTFIESIRLENGVYPLLPLHQERVNRTFEHFSPHSKPHVLVDILPRISLKGVYKLRMVYTEEKLDIEYAAYVKRTITSIRVVAADHLDYSFKFEDRTLINEMLQASQADDILMVKDGKLTDSSYANLAFWDGNQWWTPEVPLLAGVRRAHLIQVGKLREAPIGPNDLGAFEKVSLINAMLDLGDLEIAIKSILEA